MPDAMNRCTFKPERESEYQCNHCIYKGEYCVFHLPKPTDNEIRESSEQDHTEAQSVEKDFHQQFTKLLKVETESHDFRYFRFPAFNFNQKEFSKPVSFEGAVFSEVGLFTKAIFNDTADFRRAIFNEAARFENATFHGAVKFGQATFRGPLRFDQAIFKEPVDFGLATFKETAEFKGTTFEGSAGFDGITCNGSVDFLKATFNGPAEFSGVVFNGLTEFKRVTFNNHVDFCQCSFKGLAKFSESKFEGGADFSSANFNVRAEFQRTNFVGPAEFEECVFEGQVKFNRALFNSAAVFRGARFEETVGFERSIFKESVIFWENAFNGQVNFLRTTFEGPTEFTKGTFNGQAEFRQVTFSGRTVFEKSIFKGTANFREASFTGPVEFEEGTFNELADFGLTRFTERLGFSKVTFKEECLFRGLEIGEKAFAQFINVDLGKASFLDTNLEHIHFRVVKWRRKGSRQALWDEVNPEKECLHSDYERIAENYRQLVLNYDRKRDFDSAEDFHIGEMEMRRRKHGQKVEEISMEAKSLKKMWWGLIARFRAWVNGYGVYKLASNYGTSYGRGLFVLFMLIFVFSGLFMFSGLNPTKPESSGLAAINYEWCFHPQCLRTAFIEWTWVKDHLNACVYTLTLLTFQREKPFEPAGMATLALMSVALPLLAGQVALVLLAIRRRYKR